MIPRRAALAAAAILTAVALAGCTQRMPDSATGTVTSKDKVLIQKVVHYKLCLTGPDRAKQCGFVDHGAYSSCHKGDQWPTCKGKHS